MTAVIARDSNVAPVLRWVACFTVMLSLHVGAAWLVLRRPAPVPEQPPAAPEAVMLDLAAEPAVAPPAPPVAQPAPPQPPTPQPPEPQPPTPQPPTPQPPTPQPPTPQPPPPPEPQVVAPPKPPDPVPARTFVEPAPHHVPPKRPARKPPAERQPAKPVEQHPPEQPSAPPVPDKPAAPTAAPAPAAPPSNAVPNWRGELIGRLQRAKRYPDAARERNEHGVATVTFTMDRQGHVLSVTLTRSSGSQALDDAAIAMIHRAEPLPALPPEIHGDTLTLTAPVSFVLQ